MAGKISELTSNPLVDRAADLLETVHSGASYKVTPNALLGFTGGSPVSTSDSQSVTNKTLDNTNTITLKATLFTLQDSSDVTKQARFVLSSITAGNTRLYTLPDATDTLTGIAATQTLTNKTLTSPTINTPTITNASITADAITGFSSANTGTIYGLAVTSAKIAGTSITNSTVGASQLNTGAQVGAVATVETTTSTSYVSLATTTDQVTVTIGANGLALIVLTADTYNSTSGVFCFVSFVASGANTIAAADTALVNKNAAASDEKAASWVKLLTGLSTGSTTFKMQYRVTANTGSFQNRSISVIPL